MAEHVIELLEPVHIEHDNAETPVLTNSIWQFTFERFIQVASVEQARQRIADGLIAQLFAELEIRKGKCGLFRHGDSELYIEFRNRSLRSHGSVRLRHKTQYPQCFPVGHERCAETGQPRSDQMGT